MLVSILSKVLGNLPNDCTTHFHIGLNRVEVTGEGYRRMVLIICFDRNYWHMVKW